MPTQAEEWVKNRSTGGATYFRHGETGRERVVVLGCAPAYATVATLDGSDAEMYNSLAWGYAVLEWRAARTGVPTTQERDLRGVSLVGIGVAHLLVVASRLLLPLEIWFGMRETKRHIRHEVLTGHGGWSNYVDIMDALVGAADSGRALAAAKLLPWLRRRRGEVLQATL